MLHCTSTMHLEKAVSHLATLANCRWLPKVGEAFVGDLKNVNKTAGRWLTDITPKYLILTNNNSMYN